MYKKLRNGLGLSVLRRSRVRKEEILRQDDVIEFKDGVKPTSIIRKCTGFLETPQEED